MNKYVEHMVYMTYDRGAEDHGRGDCDRQQGQPAAYGAL